MLLRCFAFLSLPLQNVIAEKMRLCLLKEFLVGSEIEHEIH